MSIIYDEAADIYHANSAIGSTDIRDYLRSPALFRDKQQGLVKDETTPAMRLGTLTHLALLEPERFRQSIAIKPEGMSFASKEGKAWKEAHEGRDILTQDEYTTIHMMKERMPAEVLAALTSGRSEVTVRNELNGIPVQCRVDHWNEIGGIAYDLKTIGAIEDIEREIPKRGYHIQARFYQRIIAKELNSNPPEFLLAFVEKASPFRWRIVHMEEWESLADEKINDALHGIAARTKSGDWSDPGNLHMYPEPPEWMQGGYTENEEGISL